MEPGPQEDLPEYAVTDDDFAGVYANYARVGHTIYEFTLDFARYQVQPDGEARGVLVARVNMSPLMVSQLLAALSDNWSRYAEKALPPEVAEHGSSEPDKRDGDGDAPA